MKLILLCLFLFTLLVTSLSYTLNRVEPVQHKNSVQALNRNSSNQTRFRRSVQRDQLGGGIGSLDEKQETTDDISGDLGGEIITITDLPFSAFDTDFPLVPTQPKPTTTQVKT